MKTEDMKMGDEVTWTHSRKLKSGYNLSTRRGKVVWIGPILVEVRFKGKVIVMSASKLTKYGERTDLTKQVVDSDLVSRSVKQVTIKHIGGIN